jgi:hypothetical protein
MGPVALVLQWRQDCPNNRPPTRATAISAMGHNRPSWPLSDGGLSDVACSLKRGTELSAVRKLLMDTARRYLLAVAATGAAATLDLAHSANAIPDAHLDIIW